MQSKSALFTAYNAAKPIFTDRPRLNRALGVAQRKTAPAYVTTLSKCSCPDFSGVDANGRRFRLPSLRPCKHILAVILAEAAA
jgi:predicted nucleic acid-binding Zn finger protein